MRFLVRFVLRAFAAASLLVVAPAEAQSPEDPAVEPAPAEPATPPPVETAPAASEPAQTPLPPAPAPPTPNLARHGLHASFGVGAAIVHDTATFDQPVLYSTLGETTKISPSHTGPAVVLHGLVGYTFATRWVVGGSFYLQHMVASNRTDDEANKMFTSALLGGAVSYFFADAAGAYLQGHVGISYAKVGAENFDENDGIGLGLASVLGYDFALQGAWKLGPALRVTYLNAGSDFVDARTNPPQGVNREISQSILGVSVLLAATFD